MTKPEWGSKRTCLNCGTRFYDMQKSPIVCPKCGTENAPDAVFKGRRPAKRVTHPVAVKPKAAPVAPVGDEEVAIDDVEVEDDEVDETLMEDASDLSEDDDMAEVIDHLDSGEDD